MNMEGNILLVEDNPDDEALTLRAFKRSNVQNGVDVVRDGAEALDYLFGRGAHAERHGADLPSLVLLDLNLPKLGGLDVLREIRADPRTSVLPVIILTSSVEEHDLVRAYESGCNSYVRKPVDFGQFAEAIRRLGLYWLVVNQPPPARP